MENTNITLMRRRLANAYLSSIISISLVLMLVGVASLLLVNAKSGSDYFEENMQVSVIMKQYVTEDAAMDFKKELEKAPYIKTSVYVSREQGEREMKELLGEDFLNVFEASPIPVSIMVTLTADYVTADSLDVVKADISRSALVEDVSYQRSLVDTLNANLSKISIFISVFIALLLFISFVLINNTVRLSVYARRFTIHTMKLVGATRSFIRAPFLLQAAFQGIFAAFIAIIALLGMLFLLKSQFDELFRIFQLDMLLLVMGIILSAGLLICLVSTWFVVNRLLSLNKDDLYY